MRVAHSISADRFTRTIAAMLGLEAIHSEADLARSIEQRIPLAGVDRLLSIGVTPEEISRLVISRRALQHRRQNHQPLSITESDRLVRLARVVAQATDTFGDQGRALEWLRTPRQRLDLRSPLDLAISDTGARLIEEYLHQIDEGYFA